MIGRRTGGRVLRALHLRPQPKPPWVTQQEQPARPRPLDDFRLFCIVGAWMEADVIGATVRNAFQQGCERVFLVDNESHDDTVSEAVAAGAELAATFSTEKYDEVLRLNVMNDVVERESRATGADHVWWLWIDADEFPQGPRGLTVEEYLRTLDRRYRVVGSRFVNHFPSLSPAYITGFHPIEFQPLCEEHREGCQLRHRKHSLQRYDRSGPRIFSDRGFHRATCETRPLVEPTEAIYLHHFPYREYEVTRRRLALLCGGDTADGGRVQEGDDAADGIVPRFQTLEAVYRGDWENVRNYRNGSEHTVAHPIEWAELCDERERVPPLWYSRDQLSEAERSSEGRREHNA